MTILLLVYVYGFDIKKQIVGKLSIFKTILYVVIIWKNFDTIVN